MLEIIIASVVIFVLGALWYSPLMFGKVWMKVMEVGHLSKEELQKMNREMMPAYITQLIITIIMVYGIKMFQDNVSGASPYNIALMLWFFIIVPIQIGGIMWSQTKKKHWLNQILVSGGYQLASLLIATYILNF